MLKPTSSGRTADGSFPVLINNGPIYQKDKLSVNVGKGRKREKWVFRPGRSRGKAQPPHELGDGEPEWWVAARNIVLRARR